MGPFTAEQHLSALASLTAEWRTEPVQLILLDFYGTIYRADRASAEKRNGLERFLARYERTPIVLATDEPLPHVLYEDVARLGIGTRFVRTYTWQDLAVNGPYRKELGRMIEDFNLQHGTRLRPYHAVIISDDLQDIRDAMQAGIKSIYVPCYDSSNEMFSFDLVQLEALPKHTDLRDRNALMRHFAAHAKPENHFR